MVFTQASASKRIKIRVKKQTEAVVFTDGSTTNNGKINAKGGIGVNFPKYGRYNVSLPFYLGQITNIRCELMAVIKALEVYIFEIRKENKSSPQKLVIYTDSMYIIDCMTSWIFNWMKKGWKTAQGAEVKNQDLLIWLFSLIKHTNVDASFKHVKAHRQAPKRSTPEYDIWKGNDVADGLAKTGREKS
jgi:ribonuclease HI